MENRKRTLLNISVIVGLLIALVAVGYLMYRDMTDGSPAAPADQISVEDLLGEEEPPEPNLDRPYEPPARLSESVKAESRQKVEELVTDLRGNPAAMSKWLVLSTYRSASEDYDGAEEILRYVAFRWPFETVTYINLGNLFQSRADYPKAESFYRKALLLQPENIGVYRTLHDMYRLSYKTDTSAASDILEEGLSANPGNTDLLIPLALYWREKGDEGQAKNYFTQAAASARVGGDEALAAQIEAEMNTQ